jgi:hypothetical protein
MGRTDPTRVNPARTRNPGIENCITEDRTRDVYTGIGLVLGRSFGLYRIPKTGRSIKIKSIDLLEIIIKLRLLNRNHHRAAIFEAITRSEVIILPVCTKKP